MSDPLRTDSARVFDAVASRDRDARIEELLLTGLDHYFAGRYGEAVNVWTRVLFLDRGHARARAYIERARNALSERQRESEELLHRGVAAFDRGDAGDARVLLNAAVQNGVAPDVALSYLGRLDRLRPSAGGAGAPDVARQMDGDEAGLPDRRGSGPPRRRTELIAGLIVLAVFVAWFAPLAYEMHDLREALQISGAAPPRQQPEAERPLPVPRPAEVALADARELFAAGHAMDALRTLRGVGIGDPLRPEADRLRAEIQKVLLGGSAPPVAARATGGRR